ncbi:MAG: beta strand repeat-containing protein [Chthoniobacteraceae bacterium]
MRKTPLALVILATSIASTLADTATSIQSGSWQDAANWDVGFFPMTGSSDSAVIAAGHKIINPSASVGLPGSNDFGIAGGQFVTINGGILAQQPTGNWIRIGHETEGTLNINDGAFFFTDGAEATGAPNLQVGLRGGHGIINVGDGTGAAGSAILDLWHLTDGVTTNNVRVDLNLGASAERENFNKTSMGTIVVKSDGVIETDSRANGGGPTIRVGQGPTEADAVSSITLDGGRFNARGTVEAGANPNDGDLRSKGLIRIENGGQMIQSNGELIIAFNGEGTLEIENGTYRKENEPGSRGDIFIGRTASGVGTVTIGDGGKFLRDAGGEVADLRIGWGGTGTMTVNSGGLVESSAGNWDWVGENDGSNGTLTINEGGIYRTTASATANMNIGVNTGATGTVLVNGGTFLYAHTTNGLIRVGQNGTGTFRQTSGTTEAQGIVLAENSGTATFDLQDGTVNVRSQFFMGGAGTGSTGNGTATATQSGGTLNVAGSFVVGLATGHSATYTLSGGTANHTGGDLTVGESGTGVMVIGEGATFNNTATGSFYVGRNENSDGTLLVNGDLIVAGGPEGTSNPLRVGNGNSAEGDNTNGEGVLGGTGTITAIKDGIRIGSNGLLTAGDLLTVGALDIEANLKFSLDGTFYANFAEGNADRINLTGTADITGALLEGTWTAGGAIGTDSRYWLLVNDEIDAIIGTFANVNVGNPQDFTDADGWVTLGGQDFAVNYAADLETNATTGGNDLLLRPVPEPSTAILLGGMLCMAFGRRRRAARQA